MEGLRFVVTGRVQGVGYRAFVQRAAESMGLAGEVWNRYDGAVEGVAFGDPLAIQNFTERLGEGPGFVAEVRTWSEPGDAYSNAFEIGFSR